MDTPIRISRKRTIEHDDPDAAGFTRGYWWEVDTGTDEFGTIASGCETREEAVDRARAVAQAHGIPTDSLD